MSYEVARCGLTTLERRIGDLIEAYQIIVWKEAMQWERLSTQHQTRRLQVAGINCLRMQWYCGNEIKP